MWEDWRIATSVWMIQVFDDFRKLKCAAVDAEIQQLYDNVDPYAAEDR